MPAIAQRCQMFLRVFWRAGTQMACPRLAAGLSPLLLATLLIPSAVATAPRPPAPDSPKPLAVIPFQYDRVLSPHIVIQVRINGRPPLPFAVDTGTGGPLVIAPWAVRQLKLPLGPNRPYPTAGMTPGRLIAPITRMQLVGADKKNNVNFVRSRLYALMVDLSGYDLRDDGGPPIAGIIGFPVLSALPGTVYQFDFHRREMRLCRSPTPASLNRQAAVLPLFLKPLKQGYGDLLWVNLPLPGGPRTDFEVDTGSPFSGIADIGATPVASAFSAKLTLPWLSQTGGEATFDDAAILPSLRLGGLEADNVVLRNEAAPYATTIGLDVLSQFLITLDLAHKRLILERPSGSDSPPPLPGASDVALRQDHGSITVLWAVPGSPAAGAGVQVGDEVLSVDGRATSGLPQGGVFLLLNGDAGTHAALTVRRGADVVSLRYVRRGLFDGSSDATRGWALGLVDGRLITTGFAPGSVAAKLGVSVGDEVMAIAGQWVSRLLPGQLVTELNKSHVFVETQRPEADHPTDYNLTADPNEIKVTPAPPPGPAVAGDHWMWFPSGGWGMVPN